MRLGLIDEPFRGTSSEEQAAASLAVVEHMIESTDFFLIATHERRLTSLADNQTAINKHFREEFSEGQLVFDYRLHVGAAQTRNALQVMEQERYPPKLMSRAHWWLNRLREASWG